MSTTSLKFFLKIKITKIGQNQKKLTNFLSLLDQGISFNNLAEKIWIWT